MHLVNQTGEWHPMHLHGHVFLLLAVDGRPATGAPVYQDSVLVGPHQTADVAFLANNPGLWMFHCHVLMHASMGMSGMVVYAGVTTPYRMGPGTGNTPE
jgi:FtsP/CotA-like multicopper oxidase with cupredoxin domain